MSFVTDPAPVERPTSPIDGPAGRAELIPYDLTAPEAAESVGGWLITAPGQSPAWDQYVITGVRLRDGIPGFPPPNRQFPDATHEVLILALSPEHPMTPASMAVGPLYPLEPGNLAHQLIATDDEVITLMALMARSIVWGYMAAEPPLGYQSFRDGWAMAIAKTVGHIRGEAHAP